MQESADSTFIIIPAPLVFTFRIRNRSGTFRQFTGFAVCRPDAPAFRV
jgi:hypothetical protein